MGNTTTTIQQDHRWSPHIIITIFLWLIDILILLRRDFTLRAAADADTPPVCCRVNEHTSRHAGLPAATRRHYADMSFDAAPIFML